jgi:hypothetical protein
MPAANWSIADFVAIRSIPMSAGDNPAEQTRCEHGRSGRMGQTTMIFERAR